MWSTIDCLSVVSGLRVPIALMKTHMPMVMIHNPLWSVCCFDLRNTNGRGYTECVVQPSPFLAMQYRRLLSKTKYLNGK